jgi:hypothetical protein
MRPVSGPRPVLTATQAGSSRYRSGALRAGSLANFRNALEGSLDVVDEADPGSASDRR